MLELRNLSKTYGDVVALNDASFDVAPGTLLGFLGPNGSGKTTTMRSIFGLVQPDTGSVTWKGEIVNGQHRLRFGYMPEQRGLYPRMRIGRQLSYFGQLHGMAGADADASAARWLEALGLTDRSKDRLEDLSHGNQQRVQLAAALVHEPELLVLDEPFSGLDPLGVVSMTEILQERTAQGTAVVFSSHQLDLVEDLCDAVVVINGGEIVLNGQVDALRASSPHRYLEIDLVDADPQWHTAIPEAEVVATTPRTLLRIPATADPNAVLNIASAAGNINEFSFAPPTLSQVFREAVGQ